MKIYLTTNNHGHCVICAVSRERCMFNKPDIDRKKWYDWRRPLMAGYLWRSYRSGSPFMIVKKPDQEIAFPP